MQRKRQRRWFATIVTAAIAAVTAIATTTTQATAAAKTTHAAATHLSSTPATPAAVTPWPPSSTFSNPVLWEDLADADVFRVGDTFYYSASTMHYSPGAPILRSYDLVHWEFAGHSVPSLAFGAKYDLNGNGRAYVNGVWASFLNYRKSNSTFYWGGCIDFNKTYIYTSTSVTGGWQQRSVINNCYYDAGMMVDDNDTMYVAYGSGTHSVAQLSADGLSQVRTQTVFTDPASTGTTEGNRMYKANGNYYILVDHPANAEYVLKSTNGPFGPYTEQPLLNNIGTPIVGGGVPHQGGIVQTQNGDWYYMAFVDAYPGGRVPVLAPIKFDANGWPVLQTVNGAWGTSYPYPNVPAPANQVKAPTGVDTFAGTALGPEWEWNHNPDTSKFAVNNGLTLQTATVTNDLYSARNTLTHRILGPQSTATIPLDYSGMHDGDRAGLAMFRDSSAWIGVKRDNGATRLVMENTITMDGNWNTTNTGSDAASMAISGGTVWLRVNADITPGSGKQAHFSYSTDGVNFTTFGPAFTMNNSWQYFMGYRFGIFNYATTALGGSVKVGQFALTAPGPSSNTVTVTNPGSQSGTVGTPISGLQIHATDSASGQTLTYGATGLPPGLSIGSSGLISGTPTSGGTFTTVVTATDATGAAGSASFTWTVSGTGTSSTGPLHAVGAGKCLDDPNSTTTLGTQQQIYTCNGGAGQTWTHTAANALTVTVGGTTLCLDANAKGTTNGTKAIVYSCNGATNQQWNLNANGTITGVQSGLCLDVTGASTANGALVELWACNGGSNQQWTLG